MIPQDLKYPVALALAASSPRALARLCLASRSWYAAVSCLLCRDEGVKALQIGIEVEWKEHAMTWVARMDSGATRRHPQSVMELVSALATLSSGPLAISTIYKSLIRMSDSELLTSHVNDDDMGRALSRAPHAEEWTAALVAEVFLADKPPIKQWPSEMSVLTGYAADLDYFVMGLCDFGAVERGFAVSHEDVVRHLLAPETTMFESAESRANFLVGSFSCVLHDYTLDEVRADSPLSARLAPPALTRPPWSSRAILCRSG